MRAYNIAILIFLFSLSVSTIKTAFGYPANNEPLWTVDIKQAQESATVRSLDPTGGVLNMVKMLGSAMSFLFSVLWSSAMLGFTIQSLMPYPLPSIFVYGMNVLGTTTVVMALFQFALNRSAKTME